MRFLRNIGSFVKNLNLLSIAAYLLILAVCAKAIFYYAAIHPSKDELIHIYGKVSEIRLGGNGNATLFKIQSAQHLYHCLTYYGKVWPGMEKINRGDTISVLAERNKLNKNELVTGKRYYIWEMAHNGLKLVSYDQIRKQVQVKDAVIHRFINLWLLINFLLLIALLLIRYSRRAKT